MLLPAITVAMHISLTSKQTTVSCIVSLIFSQSRVLHVHTQYSAMPMICHDASYHTQVS